MGILKIRAQKSLLIQVCLFPLAAYVLVGLLYFVNKPLKSQVKEPVPDITSTLNLMMLRATDFHYLWKMQEKQFVPDHQALEQYAQYFQMVIDHVPQQADAYGMLGYCQYYMGQTHKAIGAYELALSINPAFMGYYYNLAVIYLNLQDYDKAAAILHRALSLPMGASVSGVMASQRVFMVIASQMPGDFPQNLVQYFEDKKNRVMYLMAMCLQSLDKKNVISPPKVFLQLI